MILFNKAKNAILLTAAILGALSLIVSCQSAKPKPAPPVIEKPAGFTQCKDPRPQMCTREYRPVCATKDTGLRCVTTPCPSTESVTYATGCTACSDPKVHGYASGACAE